MNETIHILIVDDHQLLREALRDRLDREAGFKVVGTAGCAQEALDMAAELKPDITLFDIDMHGQVSFEAARSVGACCPETRIIFLSAYCHDRYIEQAIQVQALGYITKNEPVQTIVRGIKEVFQGGVFFSTEVQSRIISDRRGIRLAKQPQTRAATLTERETQVLRHIARGLSNKQVAQVMQLSTRTAENYCARLMTKLDIHDRVALTRFAIREGMVQV